MLRVIVFVIVITGIFAGALAFGGKQLGAWEDADPPPPSNQAPILRPDEDEKDGGKSESASNDGEPTTKKLSPEQAHWIREANELCRRAREDMGSYDQPETLGEAEKLIAELQRKNEQYNEAFAAIPTAKENRRAVAKLLALFEKDERLIAAVLVALRDGDAGALLELNGRLNAVARQESDLLVGLGATDCDVGLAAMGSVY
jgi:hypothetical protein